MRLALCGALLLALATTASGQAVPLPTGSQRGTSINAAPQLPDGPQWVVVYIGSTGCGFSRDSSLKDAVRRMKPLVARQAATANRALSLNGIALDWSADSGYTYLKSLGPWDEVTVGNNWVNLGATHFVWQAAAGRASIPQVVVVQRTIHALDRRIDISPDMPLRQIVGVDSIVAWVNAGAPIPHAP